MSADLAALMAELRDALALARIVQMDNRGIVAMDRVERLDTFVDLASSLERAMTIAARLPDPDRPCRYWRDTRDMVAS